MGHRPPRDSSTPSAKTPEHMRRLRIEGASAGAARAPGDADTLPVLMDGLVERGSYPEGSAVNLWVPVTRNTSSAEASRLPGAAE